MLRRQFTLLASVGVAGLHLTATASAQQTFASRSQVIKAGVVLIESSFVTRTTPPFREPISAAPYVWFNLDSNKTIKPAGWTFVNPHAKTVVDDAEQERWTAILNAIPPYPAPYGVVASPARYSKRNAGYWEARLSELSETQIADYDVLLLAPTGMARLSSTEREKLRRFVDKGGVLWIDPSALAVNSATTGGIDLVNSFPTPTALAFASATATEYKDFSQPLLNGPQPLSLRDINSLSSAPDSFFKDLVPPNTGGYRLIFGESFSDYFRIKPVVGVSDTRFSLGVSRIGDGFVVFTSRAAAMKLNRVRVDENPQDFSYRTNLAFAARDANLQPDGLAAAKLAVNMISLAREYGQPNGGSQKSGSSPIDVSAPLLKRSEDREPSNSRTQPVFYKGLMLTTAGGVLKVYDADPARDIDGDGNVDDGAPDTGTDSYDLVWQSSDIGSELSSPVCVEIPNSDITRPGGTHVTDQVLVTNAEGQLLAFDLIRYNANGTLFIDPIGGSGRPERQVMNGGTGYSATYPINAPGASGTYHREGTEVVHAPTVHENMAYMADRINSNAGGRVWMVDLVSGSKPVGRGGSEWFLGGNETGLPTLSASPTIGFIPILDNSGGVDRVLYAPIANISGASPGQAAGFTSIWLGAKGEKPTEYTPVGTDTAGVLTVKTRAGNEGLPIYIPDSTGPGGGASPYGVHLTLLLEDGTAVSEEDMRDLFTGTVTQTLPGTLEFAFNGANRLPDEVVGVRIDYSIDFGALRAELVNAKRGDIQLPDTSNNARSIVGSLALSPRGTLYMTTAGGGRSALYGFREEGRGSFKCVMRYELYTEHTMGGQGLSDQQVPALFQDVDPVQGFAPAFLGQPFANFEFRSPPVVRGEEVYAVAYAPKGPIGPVPASILMAFKAEPETTAIYLDNFPANGSIVQPDLARSNVTRRPEISPGFQVGQVPGMVYDAELKQLRIENLATTTKGQLQAVLNLSQPIIVRSPGGAGDRIIYPNGHNAANRFDPLLWFTVINGYEAGYSALVATGSTVYVGGGSPIRRIINGEPPANWVLAEGLINAFDTNVDPASEWLASSAARPWMKQLLQIRATADGFAGNPAQRWPMFGNLADSSDFLTRLNQAIVPGTQVLAMAAGEGVLAAVSTQGLFSYSKSDFFVADQGRIASFDPGGSPTFELTTSGHSGNVEGGASGAGRPVVSPTRAYPLPNNEILVADPGANRIFRVNRNGTETRAISKFQIDIRRAPVNYPANGPLTLHAPRDVVTYTTVKSQAEVQNIVTSTGAAYEYWTHYLIADTGNRRLVEVVDRYTYDPVNRRIGDVVKATDNKPQLGVLIWHSPPAVNGKGYEYNSVSRVWLNDRYVYFAGVGGSLPTRADTGTQPPAVGNAAVVRETAGFGGVMIFDSSLPEGALAINQIEVPAFAANVFWNDATGAFDSPARPLRTKQFVNVSSVTARTISVGLPGNPNPVYQVAVMVTDASGVYEFAYEPPAAPTDDYVPSVQWMLPNEAYTAMRRDGDGPVRTSPRELRAVYARRVESGEVLVVNGYFGQTRGTRNANGTFSNRAPFRGEVVQVDGRIGNELWNATNMNFGNLSVTFRLELNTETRGLVLPVFADRR
jgi:hypothetical protein